MADNKTLITTATAVVLASNGIADLISGHPGATAYMVTTGDMGDDTILTFEKNDSLISYRSLGGESVSLQENGTLRVDDDTTVNAEGLVLVGSDPAATLSLRYLGSKDGGHAYADASVRLAGFIEGYVTNDTFDARQGAKTFFYDNALGLNLGFDKISGFGTDDLLVTTRRIYDADDSNVISFGANKVLDLSGEGGPQASDGRLHPGGQIDFTGESSDLVALNFLYEREADGVTYYYYGLPG